ncbi:hypothetical protein ACA910_020024 [Epithemia clementina (nom. ined.)]
MFRSRSSGDSLSPTSAATERRRRRKRRQSSALRAAAASKGGQASATAGRSSFRVATGRPQPAGGLCRRLISCIWRWLTRSPSVAANSVPTQQQQQQASFSSPRTSRWMSFLARGVLWTTIVSLSIGVIWYSLELFHHGADPHYVAWFSAGGFVLLGFPISMWAIVRHLANYNQPHVQVYIVRILWMVPLYSVGSWLAMRFRSYAIYIETVRDLYESYVLYSFLQFLIQVLGGEEALVLMLKDKSPTRGVHMWGLQWCVKPWLMGQPYRKTVYERESARGSHSTSALLLSDSSGDSAAVGDSLTAGTAGQVTPANNAGVAVRARAVKRVVWKSPFFVKCKFGVLQYVLLKFVSAICIMLLEHLGLYHEGDFTPRGGYLYICFVTNLSQCWALYCLVFFYYATHNELSPIRPVGKFLSVKALVFFTWWQSVMISILLELGMIPEYNMQLQDWSSEDVAKGLQDYLICIEMFVIAIVHSFVFPHSEYTPQAVEARSRALNLAPMTKWHKRRLGRTKYSSQYLLFGSSRASIMDDHSVNTQSLGTDMETELVSLNSESDISGWSSGLNSQFSSQFTNDLPQQQYPLSPGKNSGSNMLVDEELGNRAEPTLGVAPAASGLDPRVDVTEQEEEEEEDDEDDEYEDEDEDDDYVDDSDADAVFGEGEHEEELTTTTTTASVSSNRPGFMHALLESAIPTDMVDSTVGIVKGEYNIERKTLLNHATASDQYDLFSPSRRAYSAAKKNAEH